MAQKELVQAITKHGYPVTYIDTFYDWGNMNKMCQRMDILIVDKADIYPDRASIRVGKCRGVGGNFIEYRNNNGSLEVPQEFRTTEIHSIDRMIDSLIKLKFIMMQRQQKVSQDKEVFNHQVEYQINSLSKSVMDAFYCRYDLSGVRV